MEFAYRGGLLVSPPFCDFGIYGISVTGEERGGGQTSRKISVTLYFFSSIDLYLVFWGILQAEREN